MGAREGSVDNLLWSNIGLVANWSPTSDGFLFLPFFGGRALNPASMGYPPNGSFFPTIFEFAHAKLVLLIFLHPKKLRSQHGVRRLRMPSLRKNRLETQGQIQHYLKM